MKTISTTNNATYKNHTFKILKEGICKNGEEFYLVEDLKARKNRYQIIALQFRGEYFHSFGSVKTETEANEWFDQYSKRYA